MPSSFGIALCGLGRMGTIHIGNIVRERRIKLLYIVEVDMEKAKNVINENDLAETTAIHFDNAATAFSDPSVKGAVICSPTDTHEALVNLALEKGLHILCEKPLSRDLKGSLQCYKKAKSKGLALLCAFNRRFDPQVQELYRRRSDVGTMQSIKTCSRDSPRPPTSFLKISGGIFHDCLIHDFDMLRWMVGEEPKTIYSAATVHDPEIAALNDHDTVMVVLQFPSGILAHVDISRDCRYGYDQTIQIYGTNGNLISGNPKKSALVMDGGRSGDDIHYSFVGRYKEAYRLELEHFVDLMEDPSRECKVKASDTLRAIFLSQAAEDSAKLGQVVNTEEHFKQILGDDKDDPLLFE